MVPASFAPVASVIFLSAGAKPLLADRPLPFAASSFFGFSFFCAAAGVARSSATPPTSLYSSKFEFYNTTTDPHQLTNLTPGGVTTGLSASQRSIFNNLRAAREEFITR